ncbi:MFS transporter [Thermoleptolyngbya sp. C42_A2020_037]|uniref:MFS transporter n=1 Tax=Thermoleptolyngbya sp. C42_A2020_037 TaxID=2747799 RepID=UPI0019F6B45A|nr:MFS transporter [Thermoleptolyngbya sp. C42_A2020_037]MBF2084038.1 MFS transporter [Thermoleptolyngbya sp. C42_A2020_037]
MNFAKLFASKRFRQLLVLLAAGGLTTMTGSVVTPVFPEIVRDLQLDRSWAGMLTSTHALTTALFTPVFGILADRVGKRTVMLPALLCYALFGVATIFMTTLPTLLLMRGLIGAASGAVAAATIGLLGTMYEGDERSRILGFATSAMTTAAIIFPLLGGWVGRNQWQHAFYLYLLGIPLMAIAALVFREEPRNTSGAGLSDTGGLLPVVRQPSVLMIYFFLAAAALVMQATVAYAPIYLKETIGADPALNGVVLGLRAAGAAVSSAVLASRLARRLNNRRGAIALGFCLMGLTIATIPSLTQIFVILPVAALFGAGFGIITPNLYDLLADQAPAELRASVLAIGTGFNSLGLFSAPLLLGPIWKNVGLPSVFYLAAAIALLVSLLSLQRGKGPEVRG